MPFLILGDDNRTTQQIFRLAFRKGDFEVECCSTGSEVLKAMELTEPDVVALNVGLPDEDGYQLAARISRVSARIRVLFLVGALRAFDPVQARSSGSPPHLVKPFDTSTLVETVMNLLKGDQSRVGSQDSEAREDRVPCKGLFDVPILPRKEGILFSLKGKVG
jgi:DNA-binding response OmpR family regulator